MFSLQEKSPAPLIINTVCIAALFAAFYLLLNFFTANTFNRIVITGTFPESTSIKVFYAKSTHDIDESFHTKIDIKGKQKIQSVKATLHNKIIHKLKLDLSSSYDNTHIDQVSLSGFFQSSPTVIKLNPETHKQSNLIISSVRSNKHLFTHLFLPMILTACFWLLLSNINWREIPAIKDLLNNQNSRNQNNLQALDGLRGIAALTVLFEHTLYQFAGIGRAGVWIFFVLSGFLLTRAFVLKPQDIFSKDGLSQYLVKRIKRILPMFYAMIFVTLLLRGEIASAMRHFLLVQGDGHYWTILNEMYFYIFLPFIAFACYFFFHNRHLLSIIFLVAVAAAWLKFGNADLISVYGLGIRHVPYFYTFLIGMAAGYFYYGVLPQSNRMKTWFMENSAIASISAFCLMLVFFFYASRLGTPTGETFVFKYPFLSSAIAALLILASAVINKKSAYNRILSFSLFRLIGIVGYSFYLIHPYAIAIFKAAVEFTFAAPASHILHGTVTMTGSLIIAMLLSIFTYSYIERPFLKK